MRKTFFLLALITCSVPLTAQQSLKSIEEEYYDYLSLTGETERPTLGYRTLSDSQWTVTEPHVWQDNNLGHTYTIYGNEKLKYRIYGPEWFNSYNSKMPYGQNDGALWQGRGYNTSITAGARLEAYGLELTIKPQLAFSQNKDYTYLPGVYGSPYSYFWKGAAEFPYSSIDIVQRYGDDPYKVFSWGDSEIRYTWHKITAGFGTQSPWLGPAWLNPMLGSNNADPYPKFDIGLRKTTVHMPYFGWDLGQIEGRIWTGMLCESNYFDYDSSNDKHLLHAISAYYSPSFVPGLTLGANRIFMYDWQSKNLAKVYTLFTNSDFNDQQSSQDQKISFSADWLFSKVGFEFYGEIGIDDFSHGTANPFHSAIYTVGLKQAITPEIKGKKLNSELILEWNNFEMSQSFQFLWPYIGYYSHFQVTQGYTNNGQTIGGGSCYSGNSQFIGYKVYFRKGYIMLFRHRYVPDANYIYSQAVYTDPSAVPYNDFSDKYLAGHKYYNSKGIEASYFATNDFCLSAQFINSRIGNLLYQSRTGVLNNYKISLGAKYNF